MKDYLWESQGESSKIVIDIREVGTTNKGETLFGFNAWSSIVLLPEGQTLPPAVIKLVAAKNDTCVFGNFATTAQHQMAYSQCSSLLDGMSSLGLSFNLMYVHANRIALKKEVDPILAADK